MCAGSFVKTSGDICVTWQATGDAPAGRNRPAGSLSACMDFCMSVSAPALFFHSDTHCSCYPTVPCKHGSLYGEAPTDTTGYYVWQKPLSNGPPCPSCTPALFRMRVHACCIVPVLTEAFVCAPFAVSDSRFVAYQTPDHRKGCPAIAAANTKLIQKSFVVSTKSLVMVSVVHQNPARTAHPLVMTAVMRV